MKKKTDLNIVYEDKEVIVVNKPTNLLTISTEKEKIKTLYHKVRIYLNNKSEKVFIVHRLDKDTSGLVIFAKNSTIKAILQKEFENSNVTRKYEAVVKEKLDENYNKFIKQYIYYNKSCGLSFPTLNKKIGKLALTKIRYNSLLDDNTVLDIEILTGRQNQIRVALKTLNLTLIGDKKYSNDNSSYMHLNSYYLKFNKNVLKVNEFKLNPKWLKEK